MQPDPELRAYELLQWVPYSLPSPYDEELALEGHYTRLQRQRSDQALADFDRENPSQTSPELAAFRELERLGIFTQNDFYLPSKAEHGFYADLLRNRLRGRSRLQSGASKAQVKDQATGTGFARSGPDATSKSNGERPRLKRRNPRR